MRRPERRNALSETHLRELRDAFRSVGESAARVVIVAARGRSFSAGHDFADMDGRDLDGHASPADALQRGDADGEALPAPVIAQVEGLRPRRAASSCQLRSRRRGRIVELQVPGGRAMVRIHAGRGVGTAPSGASTRSRCSSPAIRSTHRPPRWGLVNRVVRMPMCRPNARAARPATRGSAQSKALGKQSSTRQVDLEHRDAYAHASEVMAAASQIDDASESVRAFLEKRAPRVSASAIAAGAARRSPRMRRRRRVESPRSRRSGRHAARAPPTFDIDRSMMRPESVRAQASRALPARRPSRRGSPHPRYRRSKQCAAGERARRQPVPLGHRSRCRALRSPPPCRAGAQRRGSSDARRRPPCRTTSRAGSAQGSPYRH